MEDSTALAPPKFVLNSADQWTNVPEILDEMRQHLQKCLERSAVPKGSVSFPQPSSLGLADSERDQGVNAASGSRCFLLQFKCPSAQMDNSGDRPAFSINAGQLRALKRCPPGSAFYVLPLIADRKRFASSSCILDKTCIIDVQDIMPECDYPAETDRIAIYIDADKSAHAFAGSQRRDLNVRPLRALCDHVASVPEIPLLGLPTGGVDPASLLVMCVDFEPASAAKRSP